MTFRAAQRLLLIAAAAFLAAAKGPAFAADHKTFALESGGARVGIGATSTSNDIWDAESFFNFSLPSDWDLGKRWRTWLRLDLCAGYIGERNAGGFSGSLGPTLVLGRMPSPLTVEAGASPGVITEWEFRYKDLGSPFQIVSHVGVNFDIRRSYRVSYRFQHMSNGGVAAPNPGLNLHFLGFSYVF